MNDTPGTQVAHRPEGGQLAEAAASGDRHAQTLLMVREAMLNPDVDAEKAKVMAELMASLEDRAMASEFNRDLNAALSEMPVITKAGIITIPAKDGRPARTQGRFARFEDIDRVVRPILQRHNLTIRFEIGSEPNSAVSVRPILSHANGHTERGEAMKLPRDESGAKNAVQGTGSAASYGKRYAMCAALNIITEGTDDDGSLGKFAIDMPHEREVAVLEGAEAAQAEGWYQDWFAKQSTKDRSWLVSSGNHLRLGGELPALPSTENSSVQAEGSRRTYEKAAEIDQATQGLAGGGQQGAPGRPEPGKHDVSTPAGWAANFIEKCKAAPTTADLNRLKERGATGLGRLEASEPKLWDQCNDAFDVARDRLADQPPAGSGGGGLFGEGGMG
jgi:hypothetical protein